MIAVYCPECRRRLLSLDEVAIRNTATDIEDVGVDHRCINSHRGTWLPRRRTAPTLETL